MFGKDEVPTMLDTQIERLERTLDDKDPTSEEYRETLDTLAQLYKLRAESKPSPISRDTLLLAATNILGIILILRHEHLNVITSAAMGKVPKLM